GGGGGGVGGSRCARRRATRAGPARVRGLRRGGAARRTHRRLRAPVRRDVRRTPRTGESRDGHGRRQGHASSAVTAGLPAGLLDAARRGRLLLRQRIRHDRALLATLRERAPGPLRRPQPRTAPPGGTALAAHSSARPRHAGASSTGNDRSALPPRSRQRGLGLRGPDRGSRTHRWRRRHRGGRPRPGRGAERLRAVARGPRPVTSGDELVRTVDAAREVSLHVARRPRAEVAAALAAAGVRWRSNAALHAELPAIARLSPAVVDAGLDIAAETLDVDRMVALAERELGGAPPQRPWLVPHR